MALRLHPRWLKSDLQALASPSHLTHSPFAVMSGTSAQEPGGNSAPPVMVPTPPPSKPGAGVPLAKKATAAPPVMVPPSKAVMAPPAMVPPGGPPGNAGAPRPPVLPPPIGLIHGTAGRVVQGGVPIKAAGFAIKAPRSYPRVPQFQDTPSGPPAKAPTQAGPSEPSGSSVPIAATTSKAKMPPRTPVPQRQLEARLLVRSSTWHEGPSMPPGWARTLEWITAMAKHSNAWPKPAYFPEGGGQADRLR